MSLNFFLNFASPKLTKMCVFGKKKRNDWLCIHHIRVPPETQNRFLCSHLRRRRLFEECCKVAGFSGAISNIASE